jgi:intracellular septation protein
MRQLFASSKLLLLDMASTFLFLAVFLLTGSIALSVALGMALGVAQVSWEFARGRPEF